MTRQTWLTAAIVVLCILLTTACGQFKSAGDSGQQTTPGSSQQQETQETGMTETVTFYFTDANLMDMYEVDTEITAQSEADLPLEALKQWVKGPQHDELAGLVPAGTEVKSLVIQDGTATVDFSGEIKKANVGSTGEMFLLDQLALLLQQFGASEVQVLIEGQKVDTLYGHVTVSDPYQFSASDNYVIKPFKQS